MKTPWTISRINQLLAEGKIVAAKLPEKNIPACLIPKKRKGDAAKRWISKNLTLWCAEHTYRLDKEHGFHPTRKWRFDFAVPEIMVAVEYNGLFSDKSRHTTVTGYTGDMEKLNAAQALGWKVLQFTALNYKDLITELNKNI